MAILRYSKNTTRKYHFQIFQNLKLIHTPKEWMYSPHKNAITLLKSPCDHKLLCYRRPKNASIKKRFSIYSSWFECSEYVLHFSKHDTISSGSSELKRINSPVVGCSNPNVFACNACLGRLLKQF